MLWHAETSCVTTYKVTITHTSRRNSTVRPHTKESVPDDEDAGVVLVDTVAVPAVMDAVMTRRVEDPLQRPQLVYHLQHNPRNTKMD